ncbi:MAG TPA: glycerol kinase GlpK [Candidatus Hydrogenedentes bacterium]|jgi:glycerol kinase|nr:MAG: Glycerol kinase [Candidatus Hydrogenedentes bacterium ADurb.Bin170]HNZ48707.1 glycerol kinase GlpK [Candidatus Hydrogenedentota bacterium]HOD96129.1 glycerol kinase GlpK [Candidatus Hydrogenedentota bacterium]HOR49450.1 glycerol kinase GlpK [Candidatus Hydrogenedentota bacterium]HPK24410.1 glycerol kinase GlpK [Candidatus Hydrogenedentota bacterium]
MKYVLALDQGTTSSRAIIFDQTGTIRASAQQEFEQIFPEPGLVEHDPSAIWTSQLKVAREALLKANLKASEITAVGIANQRETTLVWDRKSGTPLYNAIVWQDRRTSAFCETLRSQGYNDLFREKTGLLLDPYFSGTKIKWILDHVEGASEKARRGELAFGTVDTWLLWNLSGGRIHMTDASNASRTLLYNLHTGTWDNELLELLAIPASLMPEIVDSSRIYGYMQEDLLGASVPIAGMVGDQQAALFGQLCTRPGMAKNTYGTGCFMLMNTGSQAVRPETQLLTTVAWQLKGELQYALEGSVFVAGAVVQWLRDQLGIISSSSKIETLARTVPDNGGVYFVPAFTGLGAPWWDPHARGTISGLTRGATAGHLARAALEGIAFQVEDVLDAMSSASGVAVQELRVDGGAAANNLLMQFQANISNTPIIRPKCLETTAAGAAYLAGLATGVWDSVDALASQWEMDSTFAPAFSEDERSAFKTGWHRALQRAKS